MSIVQVEFGYDSRVVVKKLDEETYQRLRQVLSLAKLPETREDKDDWLLSINETLIDLEADGPFLSSLGLEFRIKRFKGNMWLGGPGVQPRVVHVHIPNVTLFAVDEVTWRDDCCTEELQELLNAGWRILAVCPPCNQRRPDYVLGRTRPLA